MKRVMQKSLKMISKFIFFGLLICVTAALMNVNTYSKADAAILKPAFKEAKKTLYVGYDTYKIKIKNLAQNAKITYESDDEDVAAVSKSGIVTAKSKGTIEISAEVQQNYKTYQLSMDIEVLNPSIAITDSTDYLNVSDTYTFKCETLGIRENAVWSVSDNTKATITSDGQLTANAAGKVTVIAKAGDKTAECSLSIGTNRLGTFSNNITCYNGNNQTIWITISNKLFNEELAATNNNPELFDYEWGQKIDNKVALTITPKKNGQGKLVINSDKTDDKLIINVKVADKPYKSSVSDVKEACQKYSSATVEILSYKNSRTSIGTGFFIADGIVVTNNHIIKGADMVTVKTDNGTAYDVKSVVGYDEDTDIAILKIDSKNDYLELNQSKVSAGNDAFSFGNPLDSGLTALQGSITSASFTYKDVNYIQISTPISSSNSGGPLINSLGEVLGINTVFSNGLINMNLVIDISEIQKINTNNPLPLAQYNERVKNEELVGISNVISENDLYNNYFYSYNNNYNNSYNYNNYYYNNYNYSYSNMGLPSGIAVRGTIIKYTKGDYFKIKVTNPCTLVTQCYFDNYSDFQKCFFDLCDSNLRSIASGINNVGSLSYKITYQLSVGEYYVYVYTNNNTGSYNGSITEEQDIPYSIKVIY